MRAYSLKKSREMGDKGIDRRRRPVKNRTLLLVLLAVGFVGATSCGNDNQTAQLQAENAALRAALAQQAANGGSAATNVTVVQVATAVANVTVTSVNASVTTSGQTTVVYTVTSSSTGTAVRQ
jgi:hypothetical protein